MKTLKIFCSIALLSFIGYLISCDVVETDRIQNVNRGDFLSDCNAPYEKCPLPSYCDDGKGMHLCLYLFNGDTDSLFNYFNIYKAEVIHTGYDCANNSYYCRYVTSGSSAYGMGCVLPWCDDDCIYTRFVCIQTNDNKTYTGQRTFGYDGFDGCTVTVYESDTQCDFGGIEKIYNEE